MGSVSTRKLAVVTGASSGIGLELARECVEKDFDLVICAGGPRHPDRRGAPRQGRRVHPAGPGRSVDVRRLQEALSGDRR